LGNADVKIYKSKFYLNRKMFHCERCGELLEDGDRIITRSSGNSYAKGFTSGSRLSHAPRPWGLVRIYHADTCYYAEAIAAK